MFMFFVINLSVTATFNGRWIETWTKSSRNAYMLVTFLGAFVDMGMTQYPRMIVFANGKITSIHY